ncbi:MAG TPA: hypothetical protein PK264_24660, partial [Hyphomicrobiaceae bacterium]|nr:hypothetical protein [Hyphomicrobiaceae bacterium]
MLGQVGEVVLDELALSLHARGIRLRQRHGGVRVIVRLDLLAAVVAAIGDGFELVDAENLLGLAAHVGKLCPIRAAIRHLVRNDEMVLSVDRNLHVVADDARAAPARRHRAAVGISQRDLLVGQGQHRLLVGFQFLHFSCQLREVQSIEERVDGANRIALVDPIIEAFRQQRRLPALGPFHEPLHDPPPQIVRQFIPGGWCGASRRRRASSGSFGISVPTSKSPASWASSGSSSSKASKVSSSSMIAAWLSAPSAMMPGENIMVASVNRLEPLVLDHVQQLQRCASRLPLSALPSTERIGGDAQERGKHRLADPGPLAQGHDRRSVAPSPADA